MCRNACVRMDFEKATDFNFKCPECGELMNQVDNARTIDLLKDKIGELRKYLRESLGLQKKMCYQLYGDGYAILPILEAIHPFPKLKKRQCELVMAFIRRMLQRPPGRWSYYTEEDLETLFEVEKSNLGPEGFSRWKRQVEQKGCLTSLQRRVATSSME